MGEWFGNSIQSKVTQKKNTQLRRLSLFFRLNRIRKKMGRSRQSFNKKRRANQDRLATHKKTRKEVKDDEVDDQKQSQDGENDDGKIINYKTNPPKTKSNGPLNTQRRLIRNVQNDDSLKRFFRRAFGKLRIEKRSSTTFNRSVKIHCREDNGLNKWHDKLPIYFRDDFKEKERENNTADFTTDDGTLHELSMTGLCSTGLLEIVDQSESDVVFLREVLSDNKHKQLQVVATKLGEERCRKIPMEDWRNIYGRALEQAMMSTPNNKRGNERQGKHEEKYCLLGVHFDYLNSNTIRPYAHIKGMDAMHVDARRKLIQLIKALEYTTRETLSPADLRGIAWLREKHGLWRIMFDHWKHGRYAQMALTRKYTSPWHTDDDATPTLLCVYSPSTNFDEILCYFVLPTLHKAVPMRNGDVIVFDSTIGHCVTRCWREDTFIFSLFTGTKTALTQMSAEEAGFQKNSNQTEEDRFQLV